MIKAIIIDDEPKAIEILSYELKHNCPSVLVEAVFTDTYQAKKYLQNHTIDCVFLDIEMPETDGFRFLKSFPGHAFSVVFTTAYDQYAIRAIKENALDYLLKPIDIDELIICVSKLNKKNESEVSIKKELPQKIAFSCDKKILFIEADSIIYCKSDGNYCEIYTENGEKKLLIQTLKSIEQKLAPYPFVRVHNSFLVNSNKIKEYHKQEEIILLNNGVEIPVSRHRKSELLKKI